MPSLNPNVVIPSKDFRREQVQKSLHADRHVEKKSENQERNKPLCPCPAIQVRPYAYFKKRRKIPYETVKRNWHREPEYTNYKRRSEKDQKDTDDESKQCNERHEVHVQQKQSIQLLFCPQVLTQENIHRMPITAIHMTECPSISLRPIRFQIIHRLFVTFSITDVTQLVTSQINPKRQVSILRQNGFVPTSQTL